MQTRSQTNRTKATPPATTTASKRAQRSSPESNNPSTKRSKSAISPPKHENTRQVLATTFGIEIELVFAFKEDLLKSVLSESGLGADMIKTFNPGEHKNLVGTEQIPGSPTIPAYECRFRSPSWALHVPETDLTCDERLYKGMGFARSSNGKQWVRRYVMEPLLVAKGVLEENGLGISVVGWTEPHSELRDGVEGAEVAFPNRNDAPGDVMLRRAQLDYEKWTLTNDHTIIGALRSQLHDHLSSREVSEAEFPEWDSYGMEMISRVFTLDKKNEALAEVGNYLQGLITRETSTMGSVWASAHVHIGFDFKEPGDMPVLLLQHLANILVLHEDLISKCHPRSRSGVSVTAECEEPPASPFEDDEDFDPNDFPPPPPPLTDTELGQDNEDRVLRFEGEYTGAHPQAENVKSNARHLRKQLATQPPTAMAAAIFKQDGTIFDLVDLLQHKDDKGNPYRGYMYNFANLVNLARNETRWKSIKPTVEFRQHACALDADVLKHWVTLLEAIVRKAEDNASKAASEEMMERTYSEQEASKCPVSTAQAPWPYQNMKLFCTEFLGLNEVEGEYWLGRFEEYKNDRPKVSVEVVG